VESSVVVPLPISVADNRAAAFLPLVDQPPLVRIVQTMLGAVAEPGRVVVAAAEALVADVRATLASKTSASIVTVSGAATRADCLGAALEYLRQAPFSTTHVLVHDIGHPLVSDELAERVVAGMRSGGTVVVPALAVTDSVKAVDAHGSITATVDRSVLRTVQYPRGFTVDALAGLLEQSTSGDFDEIAVAIGAGAPVTFVDGHPDAFRAELPRDAAFIEAIIASGA
jgi:2-C-methyl-D-erythritol 4-phosphate cytidylyltransferase